MMTDHLSSSETESALPVTISADQDGQIVTVVLNRPEARNALSTELVGRLLGALESLASNQVARAVIVTGAGTRAFCAGADLKERLRMTPAERSAHTAMIADAAERLAAFPMPTIAAIRGYALAGGAELAIACDLRVAGTDAVIGFSEVRIGIFPGAGGVYRLPRLIGIGQARDLLFTGRQVAADEAFRLGLIDRLVEPDQVLRAAAELAGEIAANAPLAVRAVKRALAESIALSDSEARRVMERHRQPLDRTRDYDEGLAAFAERRRPVFRGE